MAVAIELEIPTKKCSCCGETKPITEFVKRTQNKKDGLESKCKTCRYRDTQASRDKNQDTKRDYDLRTKYGIDGIEELQRIFDGQRGRCKSCGVLGFIDKTGPKHRKKLLVDHCHLTNKVGGLVCNNCNSISGHAKDEKENLFKNATYLHLYRAPTTNVEVLALKEYINLLSDEQKLLLGIVPTS